MRFSSSKCASELVFRRDLVLNLDEGAYDKLPQTLAGEKDTVSLLPPGRTPKNQLVEKR